MNRLFLMLFVMVAFLASCGGSAENNTDENPDTTDSTETTTEVENNTPKGVKGYAPGDIAEDFSLKNIDGEMVSMADYEEAKGFVVIFTCNHCPFSIDYEDRIIALDKAYKEKGYPVIAINPNDPELNEEDSYALMQTRAEEKGFTFPYLFDETQEVFPKYGAKKTPHCYVLQKSEAGLKVSYVGAFDDSRAADEVEKKYVENALTALMEGNQPDPNEADAFGCSIKTKDKWKLASLD